MELHFNVGCGYIYNKLESICLKSLYRSFVLLELAHAKVFAKPFSVSFDSAIPFYKSVQTFGIFVLFLSLRKTLLFYDKAAIKKDQRFSPGLLVI